jgi:hypothetical protein
MYRVGQNKVRLFELLENQTKRAMTLKQVYWHSAIFNLNFDIRHAHFDAILRKIHAFKQL